jgi:GTP-binding protein EngB required for normal cell division
MTGYHLQRDHFLKSLENLRSLVAQDREGRRLSELHDLIQKLKENQFYLVVLGQFKRGKTTLINTLLGKDLLPVGVLPLTSIITLIRHGEQPSADVTFLNGTTKRISLLELSDYVTESGNPENVKGVRRVDITYPSSFLERGVMLIDTPGIGSTILHNTQVTYEFIPHIDAAILIVSTDPPVTQAEYEFLDHVTDYVDKIFFVLNKIDYLSPPELSQTLAFTQEVLSEHVKGNPPEVYPLSARLALHAKLVQDRGGLEKSGFIKLEQDIERFVLNEKGTILLRSISKNVKRIISAEKFSLGLEAKAITTPIQELTSRIDKFNRQLKQVQREKEEYEYILTGEIGKTVTILESKLRKFEEEESRSLRKLVRRVSQAKEEFDPNAIERLVAETFVADFESWRRSEETVLAQRVDSVLSGFEEKANHHIDRILDLSANLFDVNVESFQSTERLPVKTRFEYRLEDDPTFFRLSPKKLSPLLPRSIITRWVVSDLLKKIEEKVSMNCGRIRYDWAQRLDETYRNFKNTLNEKVQNLIDEINGVLERGMKKKVEAKGVVEEKLRQIQRKLEALMELEVQLVTSQHMNSHKSQEECRDGKRVSSP